MRTPKLLLASAFVTLLGSTLSFGAEPLDAGRSASLEVRGGTASFDVATSLPAISVHGKSNQLQARARLRSTTESLAVDELEATVPVSSLTTGMKLRDEHMRTYVFTTPDGDIPDLRFVAHEATCSPDANRTRSTCQVSGDLAIRGEARPFSIALIIRNDNGAFHAAGDGVLKLSAYGIAQLSQFGVKTLDDVKLHLEFTARTIEHQASLGEQSR